MAKTRFVETHEELSVLAAEKIFSCIQQKPDAVVCLAGGDTPLRTFDIFIEKTKHHSVDLSKITFVGLDEWIGLDGFDKGSCRNTLDEYLFSPLNVKENQIIFFDGKAESTEGECNRIRNAINRLGGLDFILLGIGENGHLGFNEPDVPVDELVHIVTLDNITRESARKYFSSPVNVSKGITLGMKLILSTKEIVTIASGESKAPIVDQIINGPVTHKVPASLLNNLEIAEFIFDKTAASKNFV
ncbi:glucosamine-6-phosphate deaminase [Lentibacillus salinarum]|uniref:Glucosamine-6-phosphate deaminase n=1 Tax=Lentibacillus salinarum TaxID=446820 RepID=A0ABW3ZX51_9BACI